MTERTFDEFLDDRFCMKINFAKGDLAKKQELEERARRMHAKVVLMGFATGESPEGDESAYGIMDFQNLYLLSAIEIKYESDDDEYFISYRSKLNFSIGIERISRDIERATPYIHINGYEYNELISLEEVDINPVVYKRLLFERYKKLNLTPRTRNKTFYSTNGLGIWTPKKYDRPVRLLMSRLKRGTKNEGD